MSYVKYPQARKGMSIQQRSWFLECHAANANQFDLETMFHCAIQSVFMKKIHEGEVVELPTNVPKHDDWELYQQYKGAFHILDSLM
eukprot:5525516-Ditylum_brightwellii.AAC.1